MNKREMFFHYYHQIVNKTYRDKEEAKCLLNNLEALSMELVGLEAYAKEARTILR
jgi:hypothetical protein